jgi:hypothetical protein
MRYHGDEEVKGFDRFIPTRRSVWLLILLFPMPAAIFAFLVGNHDFLLAGMPEAYRLPWILSISLGVALLIAALLILELAFALNHSKHGKIKHFSNEHSSMSFKWLASNAAPKHYIFLAGIFTLGVAIGHYF